MKGLSIYALIILLLYGCNNDESKKEYFENGKVKMEVPYNKDGKINGIVKSYFHNVLAP